MTLVEALVAAGLATVVFAGTWQLYSSGERAFERISKDLEVQARWAPVQERLVRELRRARGFRTPGDLAAPVVIVKKGSTEEELRFETGGRIVRGTVELARDLPLEDLSFQAIEPRLLEIRARLAWVDATGRSSSLVTRTRVMARNAPLGALQLEDEP